jgi:predicted small secreted protein
MNKLIAAVIFVACAATLAGCETMKGAGKDIEDAGQNIQKSAN